MSPQARARRRHQIVGGVSSWPLLAVLLDSGQRLIEIGITVDHIALVDHDGRNGRNTQAPGVGYTLVGPSQPLLQQGARSEEHTSELQSLMRISYAVFCLKKKKNIIQLP